MGQSFDKEYIIAPHTKLYDTERGIITAGSVDVGTTYDWWGNNYDFIIEETAPAKPVMVNAFLFVGETSRLPLHGMIPARKWFLKNRADEEARREMFAERFEMDETGHPVLVCDGVTDFIELNDIVPFYGVTVMPDMNELKLHLDQGRPMCFFNKSLGYQTDKLVDIMWYWASGSWFHTLKPIDEALVQDIWNGDGIFYEGYRGYVDMVKVNVNHNSNQGHTTPLVKIKTDPRAVLDFGHIAL